ncbi:MAG TPA: CHRD domain-containing protein [Nitrososphaeraceae archaeon]|nr:CHRD domain-containing protein [Nitrososphaeraceae archaeon]
MAKILRVVALASIIAFSIVAAIVGGILGIIIAPPHNNQATAQMIRNQTTMMVENQTMMENPDFDARLTGESEVPPVQTNASGFADLDVEMEDGQRVVDYHLYISDIERVTQAHIHQGNSSENGLIIVPLFNASTPTGPVTGQLAEGHITSANFVGPLQGKQLDDLIALMQNETAYVNVHTEQNPQGEIRGTVLLDDSAFEGEEDDFEDEDEGEGEDDDFEDDNG